MKASFDNSEMAWMIKVLSEKGFLCKEFQTMIFELF